MAPSDVIALGALCLSAFGLFVSVLISIAGFIFNYRTNKENIKARRAEITTEKSIEAYREVVEKMHWLLVEKNDKKLVDEKKDDVLLILIKNRLYFPLAIAQEIIKVTIVLGDLYSKDNLTEVEKKKLDEAAEKFVSLISRLQKYIGLELEELP